MWWIRFFLLSMVFWCVVVFSVPKIIKDCTPVPACDLSPAEVPEKHLYPEDLLEKGCPFCLVTEAAFCTQGM